MDAERLKQIRELFDRAIEQAPDARAAFLKEACPDADLCRDVERLVAANDSAGAYFDDLADRVANSAPLEVESASREQIRIGSYQTIKIIGQGGMGAVFLAARADGQFDQQVALKLIRLGMDSDLAVRRFLAERQIVARLDHPSIARLLDGGVTDEGRPYFVMEYVAGTPITEYCEAKRLSIHDRLRLFMGVCEAVQYAHRNLIVHRDIKPGNILVTGEGTIKLLDFGIAKLLDPGEAGPSPTLTEPRERVMTLTYAAPEQIRGEPISTTADVYALGVVLYELLTGRRPHEPEGRGPADFERDVLESEPTRPSQLKFEADVAAARASRPERLKRTLAGDLDTICLTALRKEPARRYGSAQELSEDVRRYLLRLPIAAREVTFGYRAAKFVRRHRLGVAVGAAAAVILAAFTIVLALQSVRLARERDKSQQVANLFIDIFEVADPGEARGASVTAREVLDRGVSRIQAQLGDQPEVQAELMQVIGRVYQNLGLYARATPLVEATLDARRRSLAPDDPEVAVAISDLGELQRLKGDYPAAERTLREALALETSRGGGGSAAAARTRDHLGKVLYATGHLDEAEQISREALEINRATVGPGHEETAESLNNIGAVRFAKGDDAAAEPLFREVLAIRRARLGNDHPLVPAALNNLASLLSRKGDHASAEAAYREALDLYRSLFGADHPRVATTLNNLALTHMARKEYDTAEPLLRDSLVMRRKLLPATHPDIAQSGSNLGLLLQETNRLDEAETMYREAVEIRLKAVGDAHPLYAQSLNNLGQLAQARNDYGQAETLMTRALEVLRTAFGPAHEAVANSLHNLGALAEATGDLAGAEARYREALAIREKVLPTGHPNRVLTETALARLVSAPR